MVIGADQTFVNSTPDGEHWQQTINESNNTHVAQSMCTKYVWNRILITPSPLHTPPSHSSHPLSHHSPIITPSLDYSSYPPPLTLNIQPSLPNITFHIPSQSSSLDPHIPFFLHPSGSDTAISCEGVDMEDGEERSSLTPDSDLTMAGMTLHQLIQEHFTDLLRCLPRMLKMKMLFWKSTISRNVVEWIFAKDF